MLAPLAGVCDSLVKALGLMLATLLIVTTYGLCMQVVRPRISPGIRLIASVALSATVTSCVALALQAWSFELHQQLGIYLTLIALQCLLLEHTGFFERPVSLGLAGLFGVLLLVMGCLREVLGNGSLGSHLPWLAGMADTRWHGWIFAADGGLRLMTLAPGGFILLGLLIAAKQALTTSSTPH